MSSGFSSGDFIAVRQLCRYVMSSGLLPESSSRANHTLRLLGASLSEFADAFKGSDLSALKLSLNELNRDGLPQIRRDIQALVEVSQKQTRRITTKARLATGKRETEACVDRLSEDEVKLRTLLSLIESISAKDTTCNQKTLLPAWTSIKANSSEENGRIRQWLTGWNNDEVHAGLVSNFQEDTGLWMLEGPEYHMWKNSQSSFLWLYGIPGSGKSVLSAQVIETLRLDDASGHQVAFYHFDISDPYDNSVERCLMSLIGQLTSQETVIPEAVRKLYYDHAGQTLPSVQALQKIAFAVVSMQPKCYIVLDAIDECSKLMEAIDVVNALRRHNIEGPKNLRLLVTSRAEYEITVGLAKAIPDEYAVIIRTGSRVQATDTQRYIEHTLDESSRFSPELKGKITAFLVKSCNGMFLMARLALDNILAAPTINAVMKLLHDSPPSLEAMYRSMLLKVPPQDYGMVRRILIWVMSSARPLTVEEINDAIALNNAGEQVSTDNRLINPDDFLKTCSGFLVQVTEATYGTHRPPKTLRIHPSFLDFLRSERTVGPLKDFRHSDGDRILADCCITCLLMFSDENSLPSEDLSHFPLLAYAAEYWAYHARRAEDAQSWHSRTTQLVMRLFHDNHGTTFSNWLKICDPATLEGFVDSTPRIGTGSSPLFYASLFGLRHVLKSLMELEEKSLASELEASLYAASYKGYADIVCLLLEQGASPNTEHWSGARPLDIAVLKHHVPVVELLLNYNADVTYKDGIIGNPFQTAISNGDATLANLVIRPTKARLSTEAFLEILNQGLRDAARNGYLDVVQLLFNVDENGDLDAVDNTGWTALHYAIRYRHDDIQQYLIDHGADIDKPNFAGETPTDFAWSNRRLDLAHYNTIVDLKKHAKQAFSCHILQHVCESGDCQRSIFRKTFKFKNMNRVAKPKAKKAIIREHTILQRINHPFIVRYLWYEEDREQETAQLYLEYCNGGDLDAYSARAIANSEEQSSSDENDRSAPSSLCLKSKELWRYMFQVAAALAYLHHGLSIRRGQVFTFEKQWDQILHRDIKPSNIVLNVPESSLPEAKICDLGLAKGLSSKLKEAKQTGGIGTRNYWPPEMFQKDGFWTAKGDIYSYGSAFTDLWAMSARSGLDCHSSTEILGKCMSISPEDRPSSIELLEITRNHVIEELPLFTSRLHGLLGQTQAGYLHGAFYNIAGQLDTKEAFESRSVKVRRETSLKRLKLLCDDGAGSIFDAQPGPSSMKLHIAVLLDREAAFNQASEVAQAINCRWPDSGWTPLHLAAQQKNIRMYTWLLEADADPLVSDIRGHIASFYLPQSDYSMSLK